MLVTLLTRYLERQPSFQVVGFDCPLKALAHLQHETADVLITDLRMSVMDGDELARHARLKLPGIGIILATSSDQHDVPSMSDSYQFISKPFEWHRVLLAVYRALPNDEA